MTALRNTRGVTIRQARQADEQRLREIAFAAKASWGYDRHRVARWADTRRPFGQATEGDETGSRAERNRLLRADGRQAHRERGTKRMGPRSPDHDYRRSEIGDAIRSPTSECTPQGDRDVFSGLAEVGMRAPEAAANRRREVVRRGGECRRDRGIVGRRDGATAASAHRRLRKWRQPGVNPGWSDRRKAKRKRLSRRTRRRCDTAGHRQAEAIACDLGATLRDKTRRKYHPERCELPANPHLCPCRVTPSLLAIQHRQQEISICRSFAEAL